MVAIVKSPRIEYRVEPPFFIIQFIDDEKLNALDGNDYMYLAELMLESDKNDTVSITVLQSSGRFFSAGASFTSIAKEYKSNSKYGEVPKWSSLFLSRNVYVTNAFIKHRKPIVCCLNGPAIGLSAAIVMLCDIVYCMNEKVYLQFPFAKIGLVTEGSVSITLPLKLGYAQAQRVLYFNKPVTYDMLENHVSTKNYKMDDWKQFNRATLEDLRKDLKHLHLSCLIGMKSLIRETWVHHLNRANVQEVTEAMPYWIDGVPQSTFTKMMLGAKKKSKL